MVRTPSIVSWGKTVLCMGILFACLTGITEKYRFNRVVTNVIQIFSCPDGSFKMFLLTHSLVLAVQSVTAFAEERLSGTHEKRG